MIEPIVEDAVTPKKTKYGVRQDGTAKGEGFFGKLNRPDGAVSTELSFGFESEGEEILAPLLVPTLTEEEVNSLLTSDKVSDAIYDKAIDHAIKRKGEGKNTFWEEGEAVNSFRVQPTPLVDTSFATDFPEDIAEAGYIGEAPLSVMRTKGSNKELSQLSAVTLEIDSLLVEQDLESGSDSYLDQTYAKIQEEMDKFVFDKANQSIVEAQTPEEVVGILEQLKSEGKTTVNLSTLRTYALSKMETIGSDRMGYVAQHVARNIVFAQEIQKRSTELSAGTSFLSTLGDVGEYFLPTGTASEQMVKYKDSIPEALAAIKKASPEKQIEMLHSLMDGWEAQETLLIENNNSLMTLGQFESLRNAVLQGGLDVIDGRTDSEIEQYLETGLDAGLSLMGAKGVFKSVESVFGFLSKRVFSSDSVEVDPRLMAQLFDPNISSPNTMQVPTTTRINSHTVDTEYLETPVSKLKVEQEGGLKKIVEDTGMSKEDIASRQVFTPTEDTSMGFPNLLDNLTSMNELILADKSITNIGMQRARTLETQAGTSLTVQDSATGFKGIDFKFNDNEDSLGTFTFLLGDGAKGFDSAEAAMDSAKIGLSGFDVKVVQKDGKWYAETSMEHKFDPDNDVGGLYLDPNKAVGPIGRMLLNPLRILGDDVMKGLFALKGKNRSTVQKLEDRFKGGVRKLNAKQGLSLSKILEKGDSASLAWTTRASFRKATGEQDGKVWEAYRVIRDVYEDVYQIRNKVFHQKLNAKNTKFIDDGGDGNLGVILNPKKDIDTADGLVWDIETKRLIPATLDDGFNYVRLTNAVDGGEGVGFRSVVRVKPEKISKLPENVLNKRAGHIDRFYRETGWLVKTLGTKTVDGKEVPDNSITHIVSSQKEAKKIAEREGGVAIRSRENDDIDGIFGSDNDVQFSYGSSHTKKRGEQLKGSDGLNAPVLNAFETMGKSITSTQSALDYNMLKSVETRFFNEFDDMLVKDRGQVSFSSNAGSMIRKQSDDEVLFSDKRLNDFKNWHGYLKTLRTHTNGEAYKAVDKAISPVFDPILNAIGKIPFTEKRYIDKRGTDTQAAVMELKGLVSNLFVVLNPLYQVPQNMAIGLYIAGTKGTSGFKSVLQLPALIAARSTGNYRLLTSLVGGDEKLARELVAELDSNGLVDAIGRSNDFLDMARGNLDVGATTKVRSGIEAVKRKTTGLAYNAARGSQEASLAAMNMMSYLTEFNTLLKAGKKFDGKGKAEVSFQAQKNVQTQNSLDMFKYQDNSSLLSVPLQFFQHVNKLFLDIIVDPQYRVITGAVESIIKREINSGRSIGREAGAYSSTYAKALTTTMLTYATFGMQGGLGMSLGSEVESKLRKEFPDLADVPVFEIMMNGVINETFNSTVEHFGGKGAIDITTTYGPAAFLDMVKSFMLDGFPSFNVLGVSGAAIGTIFESAASIQALARTPNIDTFDKATMIASEIMEPISGYKNIEKAVIGYLFQELPYARSLTSGMKIEKIEAVMLAANIQPALVTDYFNGSSFDKKNAGIFSFMNDEKTAIRNAETMLQAMTRDMAYHKLRGTLDLAKGNELLEKWSTAAKTISNPKFEDAISKAFAQNALTSGSSTYNQYFRPYEISGQIGNTAEGFRILAQKAQSPEFKALAEAAVKTAESTDSMQKILEDRE
jgi:hypothetical protein